MTPEHIMSDNGSLKARYLHDFIAKEVVSIVVSKAIETVESMDMTYEVEQDEGGQGVVRQKFDDGSMMTRPFMPTSSISASLTLPAHNDNEREKKKQMCGL